MSSALQAQGRPTLAVDAAAASGVLLLAAWCVWAIATQAPVLWVDLIFDDAYYYLGIARNMAEHGRSSFLPPFETNGYQPLWLLLLSATAWLFGSGERALAIQLVCLTTAFVLLFAALARRYHGRAWPALLVSAAFPSVMMAGLETVMLPAFVLLFFGSRRWPLRGVAASAVFLARLDALALIVLSDTYRAVIKREGLAALRHWLILTPVAGVYFAVNWHFFGSPVPVSGLAKSVGNAMGENILPLLRYGYAAKVALVVALVLFVVDRRQRGALALRETEQVIVLLATVGACAAYYSLMSGWSVWDWYFWPVMLLSYFLLLEAVALIGRRGTLTAPWPLNLLLAVSIAGLLLSLLRAAGGTASGYVRVIDEAASNRIDTQSFGRKNIEWVERIHNGLIPHGAFLAMGDRAGSFGYFLGDDYRFLHTEGLVGPRDYMRSMRADQGADFVDRQSIDYLMVDRERIFEGTNVVGVAEPIQGWSARRGPYLLCFSKAGIVALEPYLDQRRWLLSFQQRVDCPITWVHSVEEMRATYGGLRKYSLPGEYTQAPLRWLDAR